MVKILSAIVAALVLAFIVGGVAMYRDIGILEAAIAENARRVDRLEAEVARLRDRLENFLYRERR